MFRVIPFPRPFLEALPQCAIEADGIHGEFARRKRPIRPIPVFLLPGYGHLPSLDQQPSRPSKCNSPPLSRSPAMPFEDVLRGSWLLSFLIHYCNVAAGNSPPADSKNTVIRRCVTFSSLIGEAGKVVICSACTHAHDLL